MDLNETDSLRSPGRNSFSAQPPSCFVSEHLHHCKHKNGTGSIAQRISIRIYCRCFSIHHEADLDSDVGGQAYKTRTKLQKPPRNSHCHKCQRALTESNRNHMEIIEREKYSENVLRLFLNQKRAPRTRKAFFQRREVTPTR
jgi:hypothetical protein